MESERIVEIGGRDLANPMQQTLRCDGSDLLGLCLRIDGETTCRRRQLELEWIDHRDHAIRLTPANRIQVDLPELTAQHQSRRSTDDMATIVLHS
jgi:hypothetical protein